MKRVAILGAGYGGVEAAKQLSKMFKKPSEVEITLYDRNPFHTLMTELHEVAGGRCQPESVQVTLEKIFGGTKVGVVIDTIKDISFATNTLKGEEATYQYDYLVLGPGAEPEYFGIKGAKEHSLALWSFNDALRLRRHIEDQFLKASREPNTLRRRKILTLTVAGAGFTGIEMLGELLEWKKPLCHRYGIDENDVSVVLVEAMTEILPLLPKKLRTDSMRFLARKGAVMYLNTPITEVRADGITVKSGATIDTETLIWTCGVRGPEFASKLDFTGGKDSGKPAATEEETNLKYNIVKKARLRSNEFMQSVEFDNVYLVGDVLWFSERSRVLPQVVETALQTASYAAHNIHAEIHGKTKKAFRSNYHGYMVSIGSKFAVAHVLGMELTGFVAMAMKHLVNLHYLWGVVGVNGCWEYLQHHFFTVKDGRSQLGNQLAAKSPSYWMLPVRLALGLMWLGESVAKVLEGWLDASRGTSSSWMFSPGVVQPGVDPDTVGAATEAAKAVKVHDFLGFMAQPILPHDFFLVQWMQGFMDSVVSQVPFMLLQVPVVALEGLMGLALLGGTFTWLAAVASLALSLNFVVSGTLTWNSAWMLFASVSLMGGAGRVLGLDAWIMPWLQRWWSRTQLAKKTYWYLGDARKRK